MRTAPTPQQYASLFFTIQAFRTATDCGALDYLNVGYCRDPDAINAVCDGIDAVLAAFPMSGIAPEPNHAQTASLVRLEQQLSAAQHHGALDYLGNGWCGPHAIADVCHALRACRADVPLAGGDGEQQGKREAGARSTQETRASGDDIALLLTALADLMHGYPVHALAHGTFDAAKRTAQRLREDGHDDAGTWDTFAD